MNKRFWIAVVACWAVGQLIAFLAHGVWLNPVYEALAGVWRPKAEMDQMFWIMLVSSAMATFAFCFIFTKGYEGKGVMEGVRYGLWVTLLVGIPSALDQYWIYPIPADLAAKWAVINVAYWVILGTVLAAIYKRD